jgi:hypothetical protein
MDAPIISKNKYMLKEWQKTTKPLNYTGITEVFIGRGSGTVYKKYRLLKSDYWKVL